MKNAIKMLAIPALALTLLTGCGGGGNNNNQTIRDELGTLPENVKNYSGDLDVFIYVEGQQGSMLDIGHKDLAYEELWDTYFAKFYAAAKEFNKYSKAKINIYYCSIAQYNTNIQSYQAQKGHLPHVMHATDHVNEMIAKGYATDLSIYKDSSYYQIFDETIMAEFNFGGFQGAIPYMVYPMGIFVNTDILDKNYITYDEEFVNNFTMENFYSHLEKTTSNEIAGISQPVEWLTSIAVPSVYQNYVYNHQVEIDTSLVKELLELENTIVNYSAYAPTGSSWTPKENYNVNSWRTSYDFIEDEEFTFSAEMPWNVGLLSVLAENVGKEDKFDLLPYPMANDETPANVGMLAEGLTIGNQCPLGTECTQELMDARDTAAYFAMFMNADPRAIKAKSEVEYTDANKTEKIVGALDLPMVKRNFYYDWGENADGTEVSTEEEVFAYQLSLYLQNYIMYWNKNSETDTPDVEEYTNLKPGFRKVLEIFYDNPERRINFYGRPDNIPEGGTGGTKNILGDWESRFWGDSTNVIGSSNYAGWVEQQLPTWQTEINRNIQTCYAYLEEQVAMYYGEGLYFQS